MNSNLPNNLNGSNAGNNQVIRPNPVTVQSPVSAGGKELEILPSIKAETVKEVSTEAEIPKEVEKAGVAQIAETIELPLDLKNLGISNPVPQSATGQTATLPEVKLPISDQQVFIGLHQDVTSAFRWLSEWCVHKLHKAHVVIKVIHGKIRRVRD